MTWLAGASISEVGTAPGGSSSLGASYVDRGANKDGPFIDNISFHPVPEPGTLVLFAACLAALGVYRRRCLADEW